ncbi:MAG TPA: DNA (cytosine-5-)-methyltransferase, partial [Actinomycetota bacterium]|nr:DNA (cytosine-5-)-methyltransferase [Actinomycetota bacterium]HPQ85714.1 DNA (cytosine-5-)-methyltransferase [Actinomycetota bacterium]
HASHRRRTQPPPPQIGRAGNPRPAPKFVEWLMGLPDGWVCDLTLGLTTNQMITALGNGVLPLQATSAIQGI